MAVPLENVAQALKSFVLCYHGVGEGLLTGDSVPEPPPRGVQAAHVNEEALHVGDESCVDV